MLKTGAQYKEDLKAMRPNIYKWGRLIEDVTTDPVTASHVNAIARAFDAAFDPELAPIFTTTSALSGKTAHRWNTLMTTADDVANNAKMKRKSYQMTGSCTGALCAGWTVLNASWGVTALIDKEFGTDYHARLEKFMRFAEDNAITMSGALTDAKGNRALKPGQQPNKDSYLHVAEQRADGIVLRGYKIQICGVSAARYIVVMPTTGMGPDEKEFAVVAAVARDAEGITVVETRRPSDERTEEEGWDGIKSGTTAAWIIFDNVFVPNEQVFMNGENKYAGMVLGNFTNIYRAAIGACVAGQGDVMVGAAIGVARANGLTQKAFQDKLTAMAILNETTYGLGLGAIYAGKNFNGNWVPDALLAHVNKTHVATLPETTKMTCIEICGGITETGCIPSYKDFKSPIYGEHLYKAAAAGTDAETRVKLARLVEWLCRGGGIPGCHHGGGSPDTARMVIKGNTPWETFVDYACAICDVDPALVKEAPKKK